MTLEILPISPEDAVMPPSKPVYWEPTMGLRWYQPTRSSRLVLQQLWRSSAGQEWRAVPSEFGPWWRAAQLHIRWSRAGVWERAFAALREAGQAELGEVFLDGTNVRAHPKAAGAKGG